MRRPRWRAFTRSTQPPLPTTREGSSRLGEASQRWNCDRDRGAGRRKRASAKPANASMAGCHFGSASRSRSRACFAVSRRTRLHAVGDPATRGTHSDRSCSLTGMTGRTSSMATTPLAAARRSSYAARRRLWEHHFGGRPVACLGRASPHLGHSSAGICRISLSVSLMPRQARFRSDKWTGAALANRREQGHPTWPREPRPIRTDETHGR